MIFLYSSFIFPFSSAIPIWTIVSSASLKKLESYVSEFITSCCSWLFSLCRDSLTSSRLGKSSSNGSRNLCFVLVKRVFVVAFFCCKWAIFFLTSLSALFSSYLSITDFCLLFLPITQYLLFISLHLIIFSISILLNYLQLLR